MIILGETELENIAKFKNLPEGQEEYLSNQIGYHLKKLFDNPAFLIRIINKWSHKAHTAEEYQKELGQIDVLYWLYRIAKEYKMNLQQPSKEE